MLPRSSPDGIHIAFDDHRLGVCLRNNVLNDNRLYQSYYYDIIHIKVYYSRIGSACNAIRL